MFKKGFSGGAVVKSSPANAGDIGDEGSILGSRRIPWRKKCQPTPVLSPGKSHGQMTLVGYSPWGPKRVRHDWATQHTHKNKECGKECVPSNPKVLRC